MKTEMLDIIKNAIASEYQLPDSSFLVEENTDVKHKPFQMEVEVKTKKMKFLICRFDTQTELFNCFKEGDYRKKCDNIVFVESPSKLYVFLVELKNTTNGPEKQLKISKPFAVFLISRINAVIESRKNDESKSVDISFDKEVIYRMIGIKGKATFDKKTLKNYETAYKFNEDGYLLLSSKKSKILDLDFLISENNL